MRTLARSLWLWLVAASLSASLGLAPAASAVTIDWVAVGDPGNACDGPAPGPNCFGSVAQDYRISKYEVTNAQYAEFLTAKAGILDPLALYNANMDPVADSNGGITKSGATYTAVGGRENMPVNHVSFYDALRFANWLHNGQGTGGDTEDGAYLLLGDSPTPTNGPLIARSPGANIFLPSENEWYKAAYYDSGSYFDYPAGTNTPTVCAVPTPATPNTANCDWPVGGQQGPGDLTDVGSYTLSAGPNGTFDQGGNVWEWTEAADGPLLRVLRGGSFLSIPTQLAAATKSQGNAEDGFDSVGFRVASPIPEPGTGLLVMTGVLGLAGWRRRRA